MTPLAWLRSRRAPATPVYKLQPKPPGYTEADSRAAQPVAVLQLTSALSREEVDGLRAAFTEHIDAAIAAGSSLPTAMRSAAQAVEGDLVEIVARAPWVPVTTAVKHSAQETQLLNTAFERDSHCEVCAFRYSRCYCRGNR